MSCDISKGRNRVCNDGLGGTNTLYLYKYIEDPFTIVDSEATAMNVALSANYKFELEGDGNPFTQNMPGNRETGSRVNTQTVTAVLKKMDAPTNAQFNLLVAGRAQAVIVDRNGNYLAAGIDDGFTWTVDTTTGGAKTDGNLYTLTGVATTGALTPILDSATVIAFEAVTVTN